MKLEEIASGQKVIARAMIGGDKVLATQIQNRLSAIGLLDPPADGSFGPVSQWALQEFLQSIDRESAAEIDSLIARQLLSPNAENTFPLDTTANPAGQVVLAMKARGDWICRHPKAINIVYLEGRNAKIIANDDAPNEFNDVRLVLRIVGGIPIIEGAWEATTSPGKYYVREHPMDPRGAARIELGQFKAWSVGMHRASSPTGHLALIQTAELPISRDLNQDYQRTGDRIFTGLFGINQHCGYDLPANNVGVASAGCLVGRTKKGHEEFMVFCQSDPRYIANQSYRFMTSVLGKNALPAS